VVNREGAVWRATWGVTGNQAAVTVDENTLFNIRSISKSVTALGVLMAVQEGLVDLDAPISTYLPAFSVNSLHDTHPEDLITLRHMLSNWAGFTHDPPADTDTSRPGYYERYIRSIPDSWLRFPVGYRFEYANRGHDLAGYILQVRSGMPFAEYMEQKVLQPLGMTESSFDQDLIRSKPTRAIGLDTNGRPVALEFPEIPAAGLYTSIRDVARYMRFHLNGGAVSGNQLLREDLFMELHTIQFARSGQRTGYALGLWREPVGKTYSLYHEGGGRGFGAHMILFPELRVGAAILTNREYHGLTGHEGRLVQLGPIINRAGLTPVTAAAVGNSKPLDVGDDRVTGVLGRYGDSPGTVVGFENGVLGLRLAGGRFYPLTVFTDGGELVGFYSATNELRFLPPFTGRHGALMIVNRAYDNHHSHYLDFNDSPSDQPGPNKPGWQAFTGKYDVIWEDEPTSAAAVEVRNGYLYFRDGKAREVKPGLFVHYNGEMLDFRSDPPTYATQELRRR
jgi:CubicO group peptidase (beta-lactamase class C family)